MQISKDNNHLLTLIKLEGNGLHKRGRSFFSNLDVGNLDNSTSTFYGGLSFNKVYNSYVHLLICVIF